MPSSRKPSHSRPAIAIDSDIQRRMSSPAIGRATSRCCGPTAMARCSSNSPAAPCAWNGGGGAPTLLADRRSRSWLTPLASDSVAAADCATPATSAGPRCGVHYGNEQECQSGDRLSPQVEGEREQPVERFFLHLHRPGCVTVVPEAGDAAGFCFVRIHGKRIVAASSRDGPRDRCSRRWRDCSMCPRCRTRAASAPISSDAAPTTVPTRGSVLLRRTLRGCRSDAAVLVCRCT